MTSTSQAKNQLLTVRIDRGQLDSLRSVRERDGIGVSEQVRRAVRAWLTQRGIPAPRLRARVLEVPERK